MSALETALVALRGVVAGAAPAATVERNADAPQRLPPGGLVVLRDGSQEDALEMFSPLRYAVTHAADIEIVAATESARDTLQAAIVAAIVANRTLSGAVDWAHPDAPSLALVDFDDAPGLFAARVPVQLLYVVAGSAAA